MCEKVQGIAGVYLFHDFTARGRKNHLATMVSRRMCAQNGTVYGFRIWSCDKNGCLLARPLRLLRSAAPLQIENLRTHFR